MKNGLLLLFSTIILVFTANSQTPIITSFDPSSGSVGTLVTISGTNLSSPTSLTIGGTNAIVVSNTGTSLVAMVMPGAVSGVVSITTSGGTISSSSDFNVLATGFPSTQQGSKLVGTGSDTASQGSCVAISADGNTAVVGGSGDSDGIGAVWIYIRIGSTWSQQGSKLVGSGAVGNSGQGQTVAISADGNTVLVGGPNDNSGEGAAWVFTRNGSTWSQQGAKLLGSGAINTPVNARQGQAVSLSADGNTALIGGYLDNNELGAAWIFTRSGSSWVQQGSKLIGTGAIGTAWQGVSVAISADGNTALAGGFNDNGGLGAVWVFARNGSIWTQQGPKLVGSGIVGVDIEQGNSVAISADGNTAIEGGIGDSLGLGAAWVFNRAGGSWSQQGGKLVGVGAIGNAWQGFSVAISADGSTAIESGLQDNDTGATWVFTKNAGIWTQQGSKLIGSGGSAGAYQGYSVALSADGNTAIIGGFGDNKGIGAAWVFVSDGTTGIEEISIDQNRIQLFPNPNKGSFTLQTSYNVGDRYFITDMLGNVIVHDAIISDSQIIQIPEATEGIYTMVVTGAKPVRFIIMR